MSADNPKIVMSHLSELFCVTWQNWCQSVARQTQQDYEEGIILWKVQEIRKAMPRIMAP